MCTFCHGMSSFDPHPLVFIPIEERSLSTLEEHLEKREFEEIAADANLFWLAFCKAAAEIPLTKRDSSSFFPVIQDTENGKSITVYREANKELFFLDIKKIVNYIRPFFQNGLKRPVTLLPIEVVKRCYLHSSSNTTDLTDWLEKSSDRRSIYTFLFNDSIRPVLPQLANLLGISFCEHSHEQKIRTNWSSWGTNLQTVQAIILQPKS